MDKGYTAIISVAIAIAVCLLLLRVLNRKEPFKVWSNGNTSAEVIELEAKLRAMLPAVWMDGETFFDDKWIDKSGNSNDSVKTQNIKVSQQKSAAYGCDAAFKFITGKSDEKSSLVLSNGWPSNDKYTFFHVTRYDGRHRNRIWTAIDGPNSGDVNWLSGHHGDGSHKFYHDQWIQRGGENAPTNQFRWQLSTDRPNRTRSRLADGRVFEGREANGFKPLHHGVGIGPYTNSPNEQSDWACAEVVVFDRRLSNAECSIVERYLELKYGFDVSDESTPGWTDAPIKISTSPGMCMDVAGGSKSNGGRIHMWKCHNGANQDWTYMPDTQQIKDKNSGKCLDLPRGRQHNGNQLQTWSCGARNNNQKWEIVNDNVLRKPGTNKCVDISNNSTKKGTNVQLWDCHDGDAQKWSFDNRM
jgi:hypothetical protein